MKTLSISIVLLLFILKVTYAQTQKGDQNLGLSIGLNSNNGSYYYENNSLNSLGSTSTSYFTTNPTYSYFIADKLDIGASIGFGHGKENENANNAGELTKSIDISNTYNSTIYLRKYFLFNNKIGIRTGPYIFYQYSSSSSNYTPNANLQNYNSTTRTLQAGINADFVYYPSKKVGLAVSLGGLYYGHSQFASQQENMNNNGATLQFLNNNLMLSAFYVIGK